MAIIRRLLFRLKLLKAPRPGYWGESILHLYPENSPLTEFLKKNPPQLDDPIFKWWEED